MRFIPIQKPGLQIVGGEDPSVVKIGSGGRKILY